MSRRTFRLEPIPLDDLRASDLRDERESLPIAVAFRVIIHAEAEPAYALHDPESDRVGIAWGADAEWGDALDVEAAIDDFLNDAEAWEARRL